MNSIANNNPQKNSIKVTMKNNFAKLIALVSIMAIALGGLNDTIDALEKVRNIILSQFTDIPSQERINKIYIRSSSDLLEDVYGPPIYIKKGFDNKIIKYYKDNNHIISSISVDGAIAAYLIFPEDDFNPNTEEHAGGKDLLNTVLSNQDSVNHIRVNTSRTNTYYIEENQFGEFGNLYNSISGYSGFISETSMENKQLIDEISDAEMFGNNTSQLTNKLRSSLVPNFFGYSTLNIELLESAILSNTEYKLLNNL
ncbi:hypothetical protein A9264_14720 [Vibrio sp. UCD-FRSSP16_10]|uniref:ETEC_3214 domain-containing protein n=1 Tax=unclassified Vibrio TaxID=2614977 RepID=UPI0007FE3200|nr:MULTISPECIES: ETEC_3214 domain-containing protein [unclassified Vibrio]OBT09488.1 hypothetical protein A9260_06605 [Vibrio sp. UCD-FRSSP16_30]OBT19530.1 hypothetical protein A9264_14720 [Vibrio sp. UCD-FRSSP16_10]